VIPQRSAPFARKICAPALKRKAGFRKRTCPLMVRSGFRALPADNQPKLLSTAEIDDYPERIGELLAVLETAEGRPQTQTGNSISQMCLHPFSPAGQLCERC
jgi:hypothetical protein